MLPPPTPQLNRPISHPTTTKRLIAPFLPFLLPSFFSFLLSFLSHRHYHYPFFPFGERLNQSDAEREREREGETGRQKERDRQTDRQTDRQRGTERERERERERD